MAGLRSSRIHCALAGIFLLLAAAALVGCSGSNALPVAPSSTISGPSGTIPGPPATIPGPPGSATIPGPPGAQLALKPRLETTLADSLKKAENAVVYIVTYDALGNRTASGSGFMISPDGLVATNHHVMSRAVKAQVQFRDGQLHDVIGYRGQDNEHDLCIIAIKDPPANNPFYELHVPAPLRQGDPLTAIGHPADFKFTVTTGIVSAVRKSSELPEQYRRFLTSPDDANWIQTNAAISGGNSGGPLLNREGEIVGLNTWIAQGSNLGFAIHVKHLIDLKKKLETAPQPLPLPDLGLIIDPKIAALMHDFQKEQEVFINALQTVTTPAEIQKLALERDPSPFYISRLLAMTGDDSPVEMRREALVQACRILRPTPRPSTAAKEIFTKLQPFVHERDLTEAALGLGNYTSEDATAFLQRLIKENPHKPVQAAACFSLASALARSPDGHLPEVVALLDRCIAEFGNIRIRGQLIKDLATPTRNEWKHLGVGCLAQNISGADLQGQKFELSEFRGKVVFLDFWADWCPYCREMYPHSRKLLEEFKDQPFVMVGVNGDQKDRALHAVSQGNVTWRSWYDGPQGEIVKAWNLESWPTTYLIDRKGRIRHKNLRGEELEKAIRALIDESTLELPGDLISSAATWKYRDDGSAAGSQWMLPEFDDSSWKTGTGVIGYGSGDETTLLNVAPIGQDKPLTTLFRTTFDVADPAALADLQFALSYDDGIAIYLNGQEVLRHNLSLGADHLKPATRAFGSALGHVEHASLDPKLLKPGKNVLAAEVHQHSVWSADLRFMLTLSSNQISRLAAEAENMTSPNQFAAVQMLGDLEGGATAAIPSLIKAVQAKEENTGLEAQYSLIRIAPERAKEFPVPPPKKFASYETRKQLANTLNNMSWRTAVHPNQSKKDYELAYARGVWGIILAPKNGHLQNTLGLAAFRAGRNTEALAALRESTAINGKNPMDLVIAAMVQAALGRKDKAQLVADQATELAKDPKWSDDAELKQMMTELRQQIAATP